MKWFKHYSTLSRKDFSQRLIKKHGLEAYARYLILLEICSSMHGDREDGKYSISKSLLCGHWVTTPPRLRGHVVAVMSQMDGHFVETEWEFIFDIPILSELRHKDAISWKRRRATGGPTAPPQAGLDKEEDKEEDNTLLTRSKPRARKVYDLASKELNSRIWNSYCDAYKHRYKVEPVRNATTNSQINQLRMRLGEEAADVVKFYLTHNDGFYVKRSHAIGSCVKDCESLRTQMLRGHAITNEDVRKIEKSNKQNNNFLGVVRE